MPGPHQTSILSLAIATATACGPGATAALAPAPPTPASTPDAAPPADAPPSPSRWPATRREAVTDVLHGQRVEDPYRWLEDASQPDVQAWMREQDRLARAGLAGLPGRDALASRFRELYYIEWYSPPLHEGKRWFFVRKHADREKTIVYYRDQADGPDQVLFDPNTMSEDGSITLRGWSPSRSGRYVAYKLSRNNADHATMYVRDLDTGKDLPEVFEGARYASASWLPGDKGFYYTALPTDPGIPVADLPGKAHVRFHALGTDPAKDEVVIPATNDASTFVSAWASRDGRWLFAEVARGWTRNDLYFKDLRARATPAPAASTPWTFAAAGFTPLAVGLDAQTGVQAWNDAFYVTTNDGAPRWRALKVDPRKPARAAWKELIAERADATLESLSVIGGHLVVTWLKDVQSQMDVRTLDGKVLRTVELPGLGSTSGMSGRPDEDEAYFGFDTFVTPTKIFKTSVKSGKSSLWQEIKIPIDTSQMTAEQVFFTSKDGTRVPMFLVYKKGLRRDGANPTLLYGYGGFQVSLSPSFSATWAVWVEHGGVLAIANLRGGGELGEAWHRAGMLDKKQNVFDDFIAAAEWLVAEKLTRPEKLAIWGGSNGGLLVGAAMVQRPDLFAAVVCAVPLLDMVRYHLFGSGKTWREEYGSAEDAAQLATLLAYSPYHHVKAGVRYPALLMMSADTDDRVDPMHARKFVAAIQWASGAAAPVWLRIEKNAGHGGADMIKQAVESSADMFAFLFDRLGMR
jgi:prolyl oligopeptidase